MDSDTPPTGAYNPLADLGIPESKIRNAILTEFHTRECITLPTTQTSITGAGVYAIYYGDHPHYQPISNTRHDTTTPIYIGKAAPTGTRKGNAHLKPTTEPKISQRLTEHRSSIEHAENLNISDFRCRYISLGSVWIRYTEQLLIGAYSPWWNRYIEGFGLHDVGSGREGSEMSTWDALHPGRPWVKQRNLTPPTDEDSVWENLVNPSIQQAKQERTYKDRENIDPSVLADDYAPSVEEMSLFDFE